jgi:hypothetical protein
LKKQQKSKEDMHNDLTDELDAERRKNKRLSNQIVELTAQLDDYKTALQSLEIENKQLKNN